MAVFHLTCFKARYPDSKAAGAPSKPEYKAYCSICGVLIKPGELMTWPRRGANRWNGNAGANNGAATAEPETVEHEPAECAECEGVHELDRDGKCIQCGKQV